MPVVVFLLLLGASALAQEELANPSCNHWLDPGECNEFSVKWYYDRYDHRCRRFHYSGCGGNSNRFNSLEECTTSCTYTPPTNADRCALPHEPGHCNADIERWFFDWNRKQCLCSYWTGCGGNSNIYYTYNHCMEICGDYAEHGPGIDEKYWGVLNKSSMTLENQAVFSMRPIHPADPMWHTQYNTQYQEMTASEDHASKAYGAKTLTADNNGVPLPPRGWVKKSRKYKVPPRKIAPTAAPVNAQPTFAYSYYTDDRGNQIPAPRNVVNRQQVQQSTMPTQFYATYKTDRFGRETFSQKIWWTGGGPMPIHALRSRYPQWLPPPYDGFGRNPYENSVTPTSPYRNQNVRWPVVSPATSSAPSVVIPPPAATPAYTPVNTRGQQNTWTVRPTTPPQYTPAVPPTHFARPTRPSTVQPKIPAPTYRVPATTVTQQSRTAVGTETPTVYMTTTLPITTTVRPQEVVLTTTVPPPPPPPRTTAAIVVSPPPPRSTSPPVAPTRPSPAPTQPPVPPVVQTRQPPLPPRNQYTQHQEVYVRPVVEDMTTRVVITTPRPTWRATAEPVQFQRWLVQRVTTEKPMSIDDIIALDEEHYDDYDMEMEPDSGDERVVPKVLPPTPTVPSAPPTTARPQPVRTTTDRNSWQPIVMPPPSHDDTGTDYADTVDFDIRPIPGA